MILNSDHVYLIAAAFLGFAVGMGVKEASVSDLRKEVQAYRDHGREVRLRLEWLERNEPSLPSVTKRGLAELSADTFWPIPEEKSNLPAPGGSR